jgi:ABC-type phosphate/phosphonate transport system permease subunit
VITFNRLKYLSFAHSAVYLALLAFALTENPLKTPFGWAHGLGWIAISLLCLVAVRRHVIPLWLAILVVLIGGLGPFAGSAGFVLYDKRHRAPHSDIV